LIETNALTTILRHSNPFSGDMYQCLWRVSVSSAADHYQCVNAINCTGKIVPESLLQALDTADGNKYLCTEAHRPGEKKSPPFS